MNREDEFSGLVPDMGQEEYEPTTEEILENGIGETELDINFEEASEPERDLLQHWINIAQRYPVLDTEYQKQLGLFAHCENPRISTPAREKLILHNLRLVLKIALGYHKYKAFKLADIVQAGNEGLIYAVGGFDYFRDVKFSYFASFWIKAKIKKYIMDNFKLVKIGTTQAQRKLFYNLKREKGKLACQGFEVDDQMLAEALGVSEAEVAEMDQRLSGWDFSLDAPLNLDSEEFHISYVESETPSPEEATDERHKLEVFRRYLDEFRREILNQRDIYILDNRILSDEPLKLEQIGLHFRISRQRVEQREKIIRGKLADFVETKIIETCRCPYNYFDRFIFKRLLLNLKQPEEWACVSAEKIWSRKFLTALGSAAVFFESPRELAYALGQYTEWANAPRLLELHFGEEDLGYRDIAARIKMSIKAIGQLKQRAVKKIANFPFWVMQNCRLMGQCSTPLAPAKKNDSSEADFVPPVEKQIWTPVKMEPLDLPRSEEQNHVKSLSPPRPILGYSSFARPTDGNGDERENFASVSEIPPLAALTAENIIRAIEKSLTGRKVQKTEISPKEDKIRGEGKMKAKKGEGLTNIMVATSAQIVRELGIETVSQLCALNSDEFVQKFDGKKYHGVTVKAVAQGMDKNKKYFADGEAATRALINYKAQTYVPAAKELPKPSALPEGAAPPGSEPPAVPKAPPAPETLKAAPEPPPAAESAAAPAPTGEKSFPAIMADIVSSANLIIAKEGQGEFLNKLIFTAENGQKYKVTFQIEPV